MSTKFKDNYISLNLSFEKTMVFRLGVDSGFFSEYNNMVLAMLYCLKNHIKFTLSSRNSNLSNTGWNDFFVPFCPSNHISFHIKNNFRSHHTPSKRRNNLIKIYKFFTGKYLTQDFWNAFHSRAFEKEEFNIPSLQILGNTLSASQKLVALTWNFNDVTKSRVNQIIVTVGLPKKYASIHIRRGDKAKEVDNLSVERYMEKLQHLTTIKDVFVATDDFTVIELLTKIYTTHSFYHLTNGEASGYDQMQFENLNAESKKDELLTLFATIEILSVSEVFVGTFNSNIGMYMAMRLGTVNVYGVDFEDWRIW